MLNLSKTCRLYQLTQILASILPMAGTNRSSHQRCSVKKEFLEISQNSQENICVRVTFLIKLQACNFVKLLRTPFLQNTSGRLLLY